MRSLLAVLVACPLALAGALSAQAESPPSYLIGSGGLNEPCDITFDPWNNLIRVAECGNLGFIRTFRVETENGLILKDLGTGHGMFNELNGVEIDDLGYYFRIAGVDIFRNSLFPLGASGYFSACCTSETSFHPQAVATDGNGDLYIADSRNNRVQKRRFTGEFVENWTGASTGAGYFKPYDIEADVSGDFLVSDWGNHRILRFSSDGAFLGEFGSYGTAEGQFDTPRGLESDKAGNIYVCDSGNHRVQKFGPDGTFLSAWGDDEADVGTFLTPQELVIDPLHSFLYVVDRDSGRLQVFQLDDAVEPPPPVPPRPEPPEPRKPAIVLHVADAGPKNSCESVPVDLEDVVTAADVDAENGASYFVYVIGVPEIPDISEVSVKPPGLGGIQLGISHDEAPALNVSGWTSCAAMEFPAEGWPASGTGNTMTWLSHCDQERLVAGYFLVTAYAPSTLSIAPFPPTGKIKTADCSSAETVLDHSLGIDRTGWISFGGGSRGIDTDGCNPILTPCSDITAVERTTWGRLKAKFGGEEQN